jgi:hypothetical protein
VLSNGAFQATSLEVSSEGSGSFQQSGGQTVVSEMSLGRSFRSGDFSVSNGVVRANSVYLGNGNFHQGNSDVVCSNGISISPSDNSDSCRYSIAGGGSLSTPSIDVSGYDDGYRDFSGGYFDINGGSITTDQFSVGNVGIATQTAGSVSVRGEVSGGIQLSGGLLMSSSTHIYNPHRYAPSITYNQTGGTNITTNTFSMSGNQEQHVIYALNGGRLDAGNLFIGFNAEFQHGAGPLTNRGRVIFSGGMLLPASQDSFGPIELQSYFYLSSRRSTLSLPANNCVVRFANSAAIPWNGTEILEVASWRGSTNGGGTHQLFVGVNGLNNTQLEQLYFVDPLGLPAGSYNGKILNSGELVPTTAVRLALRTVESGLTLFWPGTHQLQTATNVNGPYTLVTNAFSPYSPSRTDSRRFFRLAN